MARPLSLLSPVPPRATSSNGLPGPAVNLTLAPSPEDDSAPTPAAWDEEPASAAENPLAHENAALRTQLAETERLLAELRQEAEEALHQQQTEFERVLEEKSDIIREQHGKLPQVQDRPAAPANTPREEELMALSEELERERQQLKEDEASLMEQMGQMEVQMSRERAELARQRNELQRLQHEIHHELELAARDSALRERLAPLQRRQQELDSPRNSKTGQVPSPDTPPAPARTGSSGLLRRIFG